MKAVRAKPIAIRAWKRLLREHPDWKVYLGNCEGGQLEVAVPAPRGSKAGHLVVFTNAGDLWVRYSPPYMCYALDNEHEMARIVKQLVADEAVFVVVMDGEHWVETTLMSGGQTLSLKAGQAAHIVSWSGALDRMVAASAKKRVVSLRQKKT